MSTLVQQELDRANELYLQSTYSSLVEQMQTAEKLSQDLNIPLKAQNNLSKENYEISL